MKSSEQISGKRDDGIIKGIHGERFTPYALARKLDAQVILESSSFKKGRERYSILMVREAFRVFQKEGRVFIRKNGDTEEVTEEGKDILDTLLQFAGEHPSIHQDLPLPAGGVGYLSYEFVTHCDTVSLREKPSQNNEYDALFLFGHLFIVFDHYTDVLYIIGLNYSISEIDLKKAIEEIEARINDLDFNYLAPAREEYPMSVISDPEGEKEFKSGVEEIRREIIAGNLIQGVLSRRIRVETELPALTAYKKLRSVNPSPYLFYLDFDEFQLFGASPEVHVKIKDERVIIRPIAGTRRRGVNAREDVMLEKELLADPKEKAEHLMLVDLARNDIGRVCDPGSVTVTEFQGIEYYSHVIHIVSQVEGNLSAGKSGADAIRATFPAGTVSGAPKIQAIKTIDRLESVKRGFYAGLVGYLEPDGNLDTCITIRSGLKKDGVLTLQAGAGIVLDSDPERELQETNEKLMALTSSLGVEV